MSSTEVIANAVVAVALIAAYVVLTVLNHDGTAVLGILGGQGLSAGIRGVVAKASS